MTVCNHPVQQLPDGEQFIQATYAPSPCGCRISGGGTLQQPLRIDFCAMHTATPELLAACKAMLSKFQHSPLDKISVAADMARAAIAKATGA